MTDYARIAGNLRRIAARNEYDQLSDRKDTSTEWHAANAIETLIRERDEALAREAEWFMRYESTMIVQQRGYATAIEEAAARVAALQIPPDAEAVATSASYAEAYNGGLHDAKRVILALKDKP